MSGPPADWVLEAVGLGKSYKLYAAPMDRLFELVTGRKRHTLHWTLRDVGFHLERGQCLGVVGDNGAGKSTLLKLVAGALYPSAGVLKRHGRVTAILELGTGFHPEFTGRQNLYFSGALIGIDHEQMRVLEPEIIEFAGLEEAMDRPVKTFSTGMVLRLAFSLVTAVQPDLLIIDEALAVGDQSFQIKCSERIANFRANGCTILLCSHSMYHIRRMCDRAIWIDQGEVRAEGDVEWVLSRYESHQRNSVGRERESLIREANIQHQSKEKAELLSVNIEGVSGETPPKLLEEKLVVNVTAASPESTAPRIAVMLERTDGVCVSAVIDQVDGCPARALGDGQWQNTVVFEHLPLYTGEYAISVYLFDSKGVVVYDEWLRYLVFVVTHETEEIGIVRLPHRWQ